MSSTKRQLSVPHQSYRNQQKRKLCPGCGESFVPRYFETHKLKNFQENKWLCGKSSKNDSRDTASALISDDLESPVSNEPLGLEIKRHLRTELKRHRIEHNQTESDNEEDEDEELWSGISLSDIDGDFTLAEERGDQLQPVEDDSPTDDLMMKSTLLFQWLCLFLCSWQSINVLPDSVLANLLSFLYDFFCLLTAENVFLVSTTTLFPPTIYKLYKNLGLKKDNFSKYVICRKCFALYKYDDCVKIIEGEKQSATCTNILFPNHTQIARRRPCGELLLKVVKLSDGSKCLYPFKTYCYKSIEQSLEQLLRVPDFQRKCEKWRERRQDMGIMTDVFDGKIWKEFHLSDKNNFLKSEKNYGIMLNLDWFQPYEHVRYSVGVMYAVVLNLPREERFKLKNVILLGIIPDIGGEPPVQSFIAPLVDELKVAWERGFELCSYESPEIKLTYKFALMCVGCDIPATRKLCGFLGHTAKLGCSKCTKIFSGDFGARNYSGFDTENWIARDVQEHRRNMLQIQAAKTKTERERLESIYGIRYSPLCDLDYFDPIRMSTIDPMHNFYQGTAKMMIKVWLELDIINAEKLRKIQEKVDSVDAASNIGAIPKKIASSFGGFTADQWKNWTNIFSIFALVNVIPTRHIDIWRHFVLASKLISTKIINEADIRKFQSLIQKFCTEFEKEYGEERVTPNMHLHCHVADCIRDYGPVYSFWLFSFERYNGHLGSLPNNNRSIELQIMRRFNRDAFVNSTELPLLYKDTLSKHFVIRSQDSTERIHSSNDILRMIYLSKRSAPVENQDWTNISAYHYTKAVVDVLSDEEQNVLKDMYRTIYPELQNASVPSSCWRCSVVSLSGDVFGSEKSRHKRSSYVMAYWNKPGGNILNEVGEGELTPGIIEKFIVHNLIVGDENNIHLLAKIRWMIPDANRPRHYCGEPVEVWSSNMHETNGPSAYMPVQRIFCRYVRANGNISGKPVAFVCPLNRGMNV